MIFIRNTAKVALLLIFMPFFLCAVVLWTPIRKFVLP